MKQPHPTAIAALPPLDAADFSDESTVIAGYLTDVIAAHDPGLLIIALADLVQAQGATAVAQRAGMTPAALSRVLRPGSAPRFAAVSRLCRAFGVQLMAQPLRA